MEKTIGQIRLNVELDSTNGDIASEIKIKTAELIDLCESYKFVGEPMTQSMNERNRALSLAQTAYEEAANWALKIL